MEKINITTNSSLIGWKDCAEKDKEKEIKKQEETIETIKKSLLKWSKRILREKEKGEISKEAIEGYDETEKLLINATDILKGITSENSFYSKGLEYVGYFPTSTDFSIAEYCGRFNINAERVQVNADKYHDTDTAEQVEENGISSPKNLNDYMVTIKTDDAEYIKFCDILRAGESLRADDPQAYNGALENTHKKHIINAENKAIFEKIVKDVQAVDVSKLGVIGTINNNLCGKAKAGAEIYTNKSGFAMLDVDDANGNPAIKKVDGEFVYKGKYIVREFADEILENNENGAPVIIGDFKNVVRFAVIGETRELEKEDWNGNGIFNREVNFEIPLLTTTDAEGIVNGYLPIA